NDAGIDATPSFDATTPDSTADATPPPDADAGPSDAAQEDDADHSIVPPGATLGTCDPSRWTLKASDAPLVNPVDYATDGLLPTRWSTGLPQAPGQYLQIDFGGYVILDRVDLDNSFSTKDQSDYARGLDILASDDGTTFPKKVKSASFDFTDPGPIAT